MVSDLPNILNTSEENRSVAQTYIIAQNPAVLARLMMENQKRGINPAAYTTPASVFNTLAVGIDSSKSNHSLKTTKLPAAELLKLDPVADSKLQNKFPTNSNSSHNLYPSPSVISSFDSTLMPSYLPPTHIKPQQVSGFVSENLPLKNNFILSAPHTDNDFHANQMQTDSKCGNPTARVAGYSLYGSLERHQPQMDKPMHSKGGSLERHQSLMTAQNLVFHKPGSSYSDRSRSIERKSHFNAYRQQMKTSIECDSLPEEIYDFGGVGLKTCVSVKQKSDPVSSSHASPINSSQIGQDYNSTVQGFAGTQNILYTENLTSDTHEIPGEPQWTTHSYPLQVELKSDNLEGATCIQMTSEVGNQVWLDEVLS